MSSSSNNNLFQTYWVPAYGFIRENNIKKFIQLTENDNYENINMQRNDGNTLLHIACNSAKDEFIFHLLRNGAKANIVNYKGESPMYNLIGKFIHAHSRVNRKIEFLRKYSIRIRKSLNHFIQYTTKEELRSIIKFTSYYQSQKTIYRILEDFRNTADITLESQKEIDTWLRILYPFVSLNSNSDNNNNNNNGGSESSRKKRKNNNSGASTTTTTTTTTTTNDVILEKTLTVDEQLAKQLQEAEDNDEVVDLTQTNQQNQQTDVTMQDRMTMVSTITTILVRQLYNREKKWKAVDYKKGWIQNQAIRIENLMFQNATSRDEYIDKNTVRLRWNKGAEVYNRNKKKSGTSTVKKETNQLLQQIKDLKL